ncbi:hypothetical protein Agub_g15224 [Astrephomene gubernaculifera]|uniref:Uncharacterized protein n=1 Tax=Astrephomene gubernaculifera TaxID=47775 RepID=A0AAD3E397_9CHLO|nr:hypothetical protein Agub_g15224 [Astrephomene gubernaculifera]
MAAPFFTASNLAKQCDTTIFSARRMAEIQNVNTRLPSLVGQPAMIPAFAHSAGIACAMTGYPSLLPNMAPLPVFLYHHMPGGLIPQAYPDPFGLCPAWPPCEGCDSTDNPRPRQNTARLQPSKSARFYRGDSSSRSSLQSCSRGRKADVSPAPTAAAAVPASGRSDCTAVLQEPTAAQDAMRPASDAGSPPVPLPTGHRDPRHLAACGADKPAAAKQQPSPHDAALLGQHAGSLGMSLPPHDTAAASAGAAAGTRRPVPCMDPTAPASRLSDVPAGGIAGTGHSPVASAAPLAATSSNPLSSLALGPAPVFASIAASPVASSAAGMPPAAGAACGNCCPLAGGRPRMPLRAPTGELMWVDARRYPAILRRRRQRDRQNCLAVTAATPCSHKPVRQLLHRATHGSFPAPPGRGTRLQPRPKGADVTSAADDDTTTCTTAAGTITHDDSDLSDMAPYVNTPPAVAAPAVFARQLFPTSVALGVPLAAAARVLVGFGWATAPAAAAAVPAGVAAALHAMPAAMPARAAAAPVPGLAEEPPRGGGPGAGMLACDRAALEAELAAVLAEESCGCSLGSGGGGNCLYGSGEMTSSGK